MKFKLSDNNDFFYVMKKFLEDVDATFPVPISHKQNLDDFLKKISEKADIYVVYKDNKILSAVIGYTENLENNYAYISVVATLPEAYGNGYASKLLNEFICECMKKNISAVHLYTAYSNKAAVKMYSKIGFEEWKIPDEKRPDDLHLIYFINKKKEV